MGNQIQKSTLDMRNHELMSIFTFEIDNFSNKEELVMSPTFVTAFCKWHVRVCDYNDHLHMALCVESPRWIPGWKRRASYRFILLNQAGNELHRGDEITSMFCSQFPAWGDITLPLSKLKEEGVLENDKLILKVEVKGVEVGDANGMDMFEIKGFEVRRDQVVSVSRIFLKRPDFAVDFKPKAKGLKTAYMSLLLTLIETLRKPPQLLSVTEINNAQNNLRELTEAGFKLDWLKKKLEDIPSKRKIAMADVSRVEKVKERIESLKITLSDLNVELKSEMAKSDAAAKPLSVDDVL